ncbi:ABC transporter substrate-binding protein [Microbacterium resistens]|uniref:ABC transporter substrate-binding protein n=1 Tax=Microbacterium resistens TaxID=156977 RepID=UPI00082B5047|nr:ABC transporter substrate-binding protein [Microbacterium resistens]
MNTSRRRLAAVAASASVLLGLTACSPAAQTASGGAPTADGTLVYGVIGTASDDLSPWSMTSSTSTQMLHYELYDTLTASKPDGTTVMALAESMTPNADATEWTVKLRPDIALHDGGTFTSDDVIESLTRLLDSDPKLPGAKLIPFVDKNRLTKVDDLTLTIGLTSSFALLPDIFANLRLLMAHWDGDEPVGTGAFTVDSFTANEQAKLVRFDDYWGTKPGFENLTIQYFASQEAITNALRGGQIDVAASVPFTDVPSLESAGGITILTSESNQAPTISFRVDTAPFDDPRVVQALKLLVDRDKIVTNAYGGYADVGNDWFGPGAGCPAPDVAQRTYDVEAAKKLLAEAGHPDLSFELTTDGGYGGMMESAQLFAQDAAEAGVTVTINKLDNASFLAKWGEWPAFMGIIGGNYASVSANYYLPEQSNNSTHFDNADYTSLYTTLVSTTDEAERCSTVNAMQTIDYEYQGSIIPAWPQTLVAHRDTVTGLQPDLYSRSSYLFGGVTVSK